MHSAEGYLFGTFSKIEADVCEMNDINAEFFVKCSKLATYCDLVDS